MENFTTEIKETENTNTGLSNFCKADDVDNDKKGIMLVAGAAVAGTLVLVGVANKIKKVVRKKLLASLAEESVEKPPVVEAEVVEVEVEEPVKKEPSKKK